MNDIFLHSELQWYICNESGCECVCIVHVPVCVQGQLQLLKKKSRQPCYHAADIFPLYITSSMAAIDIMIEWWASI